MTLRINRNKDRTLLWCVIVAGLLCLGQVLGSVPILLACLLSFLVLVMVSTYRGMALPVLLFFLPWAPLLKLEPETVSFYTFALIITCGIGFWRNKFSLNINCVGLAIALIAITLVSKWIDSSRLSAEYILFCFFLVLFPVVTREQRKKVGFVEWTVFFSIGIICAALSAKELVVFPRIARYISVYSWSVVTRFSGYYGDPNFYSAHICAALSGVMLIFLREEKGIRRNGMLLLGLILLYCGFLSASKAFFLVIACVFVLWFLKFFFMRGHTTRKITILICIVIAIGMVIESGVFKEQWEVIVFRFNQSTTLSGLTTGRTDLWIKYLKELWQDPKLLLLGKGMTNVLIDGSASHNTIIQIVFQFGVAGGLVLALWEYFYVRGSLAHYDVKIPFMEAAVLLTGVFLPWMALDLVFFDEFFLMPMYVLAGLIYMGKRESTQNGNEQDGDFDP